MKLLLANIMSVLSRGNEQLTQRKETGSIRDPVLLCDHSTADGRAATDGGPAGRATRVTRQTENPTFRFGPKYHR